MSDASRFIYIDSFDGYITSEVTLFHGWGDHTILGGAYAINTTIQRTGAGCLAMNAGYMARGGPTLTVLCLGAAFYTNNAPLDNDIFLLFYGSGIGGLSSVAALHVGNDSRLQIRDANSNIVALSSATGPWIYPNTWNYVEWAGTLIGTNQVYINGQLVIQGTFDLLANSGLVAYNVIGISGVGGGNFAAYDDFYWAKAPPAIGDLSIYDLVPSTDGTLTQFTPLSGTVHYVEVNQKPNPGDGAYNDNLAVTSATECYWPEVVSGSGQGIFTASSIANTDIIPTIQPWWVCKDGSSTLDGTSFNPVVVVGPTIIVDTDTTFAVPVFGGYGLAQVNYDYVPFNPTTTWTGAIYNETQIGLMAF